MHYNYFRDYDSGIGRYVQSDPIGLEGGKDTYSYAASNPTLYSDPLGLFTYNKPPPATEPLPPGMERKVDCIERCIGFSLVITGGAEKKGHTKKSLHYQGRAADFGFNSNPKLRTRSDELLCCAIGCGLEFGQVEGPPRFVPQVHLQDGPGNGIGQKIPASVCMCKAAP